ncbi:MAG: hypothetical protein WCQ54_12320 [Clostridiaceae bacterium]
MALNYYRLVSDIQTERNIDGPCDEFLQNIEKQIGDTFNQVSLDVIYQQDLPVIYIKSGGVEGNFLKFYKNLKSPILLLTNGYNSFAASLEILSFLKGQGIKGEILQGDIPYISSRIQTYKKINETNIALKGARLGVIGKPSDWLIASQVNYPKIKSKTGIELVDIEVSELIEETKSCHKINIEKRNQLLERGFSEKEVSESLKVYGALRDIAKKYNLSGLTVRCFDLLATLKTTCCVALSFLNDEGIVSGCEGDIPSLISMFILNKLTGEKVFMANPSSINMEDNSIILSHCTVPISMCTSFSLKPNFESGIGIGIKGEITVGDATIFKLSNTLDEYFVSSMVIEENLNDENLCRTQIKAVLNEDVKYFLKAPLGNHHLVIEGDYTEIIDSFFNQK